MASVDIKSPPKAAGAKSSPVPLAPIAGSSVVVAAAAKPVPVAPIGGPNPFVTGPPPDPAVALRASVTPELIAAYSPHMQLHPHERYFPTSAEELFKGAKMYFFDRKTMTDLKSAPVPINSPDDLVASSDAEGSTPCIGLHRDSRIEFDRKQSTYPYGNAPVASAALAIGAPPPPPPPEREPPLPATLIQAPMYVSVGIPADASYVRLRYCFLFAYNGPQSTRLDFGLAGAFNCTTHSMAEHDGDWEGVEIFITPELDIKTLPFMVITEAHGHTCRHTPDTLEWTNGSHVKLRLALNSHAGYNGKKSPPKGEDHIVLQTHAKIVQIVDLTSAEGVNWMPWRLPAAYKPFRQFGRLTKGKNGFQSLGNQKWTQYCGRMGSMRINDINSVTAPNGSALTNLQLLATGPFKAAAPLFMKGEKRKGYPSRAPGARPEHMNCDDLVGMSELKVNGELLMTDTEKIQCMIVSKVANREGGGQQLAVTLNKARDGVVLAPIIPLDAKSAAGADPMTQRWYVTKSKNGSYAFISLLTDQRLSASRTVQTLVLLSPKSISDGYTNWSLAGTPASCALRPMDNFDRNLNAFGNGPYNGAAVGTWKWEKGQPNELWSVVSVPPLLSSDATTDDDTYFDEDESPFSVAAPAKK